MNNGLQHSIISLWPVYSIQLQFLSAVKVGENEEGIDWCRWNMTVWRTLLKRLWLHRGLIDLHEGKKCAAEGDVWDSRDVSDQLTCGIWGKAQITQLKASRFSLNLGSFFSSCPLAIARCGAVTPDVLEEGQIPHVHPGGLDHWDLWEGWCSSRWVCTISGWWRVVLQQIEVFCAGCKNQ